jgi:hypothetical protein
MDNKALLQALSTVMCSDSTCLRPIVNGGGMFYTGEGIPKDKLVFICKCGNSALVEVVGSLGGVVKLVFHWAGSKEK